MFVQKKTETADETAYFRSQFPVRLIMEAALDACRNGMSIRKAAKAFSVPFSTLRVRLVDGAPSRSHGGHTRKLTREDEALLADLMKKTAELGVPFDKPFLKKIAEAWFKAKGLSNADCTRKWLHGFLKRNRSVVPRISHSSNRKKAYEWTSEMCTEYVALLSELHVKGYLDNPDGIWNLDESPFKFSEGVRTVYAEKGAKDVLSYAEGCDRDMVTVLACGNASGRMLRPLILFDGKVHLESRFQDTEDRCYIGVNSTGTMDSQVFTTYAKEEMIPSFSTQKNLIVVDGHSSHINSLEFLDLCINSGQDIQIICLPAGQTARLQPLDAKVFGPIKKYWRDFLREQNSTLNEPVNKQNFAANLMSRWNGFNVEHNLPSGFRATGLYPFDPSIIMQTVPLAKCKRPSVKPSVVFQNHVENVRAMMAGVPSASAKDVEEAMAFFVRKLDGTSGVSADLAEIWHEKVMTSRAPKKRYVKDSRLETKAGAILLKTGFREALVEKMNSKKAKKSASAKVPKAPKEKAVPKKKPVVGKISAPKSAPKT